MSLYPDTHAVIRSPEYIDRILDLVRRYWMAHPDLRFEWMVNKFMPDYHYNSDLIVEQLLERALAARPAPAKEPSR